MLFLVFEKQERALAVIRVAIVITVDEVRADFPQVACSDRLIAHQTDGLPAGRPAVHQYESHVAPSGVGEIPRDARVIVVRRLEVDVAICGRPPDGL